MNVSGTDLDGREFDRIKVERSENDWLQAWLDGGNWHAACGPLNLDESIGIFVTWATKD